MPPRKRRKVEEKYGTESESSYLSSSEEGVTKEIAKSQADRLREKSDAKRNERRRKAKEPRSKISIWTTVAVEGEVERGKAKCSLCSKLIAVSNKSSSNILLHYRKEHAALMTRIDAADSIDGKLSHLNRSIAKRKGSQTMMQNFARHGSAAHTKQAAPKELIRIVCGILYAASRQVSFDSIGSPEFEAFVYSAGGATAKSKAPYINRLPDVYAAVAELASEETGSVKVGSFTYDGWSAAQGTSIAGMSFHYIDSNWNIKSFPLCFFNLEDMGKTANAHEAVMSAAISTNDKLAADVVIMSGTSDNDPATALGVDQYLDFSGPIRCLCHTLALAVNDAVSESTFLTYYLDRIAEITKYVNYRSKISAKIAEMQCREYSSDRIVRLETYCKTRWHSKLRVIEKYIILKPVLEKVFPEDAPPLLTRSDEEVLAECIEVMSEVRRIARLMEFDRQLTAPRTPRLVKELTRTLNLFAADKAGRSILEKRERYRLSEAQDDKELQEIRSVTIRDADVRKLASTLFTNIDDRLGYVYEPVASRLEHMNWDSQPDEVKKKEREARRAVLIQSSCLFDINECTLDWYPSTHDKTSYVEFLTGFIISEMPKVLGEEFDDLIQNKSNFISVHSTMKSQLELMGRKHPNHSLTWWRDVEMSTGAVLRKKKLFQATLYTEMARAFLSIQSSSAPVERLFSDSGLYEGNRRHHANSSLSEMLFTIRNCVHERILASRHQRMFISGKAEAVMAFAKEIAAKIQ